MNIKPTKPIEDYVNKRYGRPGIYKVKGFDDLIISGKDSKSLPSINISHEEIIFDILKKNGLVDHTKFWRIGFTKIIVKEDQVFIGTDLPNGKLTLVEDPINELPGFISYFNRI